MITLFRHAVRRLLKVPGFTVAGVLTLALGIGATTAVFSVVNAVLLRPLPYPAPDRLVSLSHTLVVGGNLQVEQSDASILIYQRHNRAFTHLGGYRTAAAGLSSAAGADAERVAAGLVTAGLFPALGVSPLRGRLFTEADDQPGAAPVVVIGQGLWARKFGGDPAILNRRLDVDGVPHEVIGIMPVGFRFPASDTALWLPMKLDPAKTDSATFDYKAVARLRDGVTNEAAAADLQALLLRVPEELPGRLTARAIEQTHMRASVRPLDAVIVGDIGNVLWVLLGAAVFVLAIACANAANLFLVRAEGRRQAVAVQRALGAGPGTILLESLSEGFLVSAVGGALGVVFAWVVVEVLRASENLIDIPRLAELSIDTTIVAVAGLATVLAALFVSGLPVLRSDARAMLSLLSSSSRSATASGARQRGRNALVVSQVALALILLAGSGLMAKSVWRLRSVQPGFDPGSAITFRIALPGAAYRGTDESVRFFARAVDRLATVPGVQAVGAVSKLPLDDQGRTDTAVFVEDRPIAMGALPAIHPVTYASPGYFAAAGIPFIAGRSFTPPDPPRVAMEAIVTRAFAQRYWKEESPIGRRVRILINGPWYTVVGVVGNVRDTALDKPEDQLIYCPLLPAREDARWSPRDLAFVVRGPGDPGGTAAAIGGVVRDLDPSLPVYRLQPFSDIVAHASSRRSFAFLLILGASGVALLLGAIGLYGVMAYVVALRTQEMGIRMALGAQPGQVRWMVSRQGFVVAILGVGIGLAGAIVLTRFLAASLFEVRPTDPAVLAGAAALLLIVAAAASWLPAHRAASIDPARALRAD